MSADERPIEGFVEADLGDVTAEPTAPWSDAERETVVRLADGDSAAFLARAREDPGFPFEPAAISALCGSPRIAAQIGKDCAPN